MSPMTMTEKILARGAGRPAVQPGEVVWVDVDVLLTHDVCGPGTFGIFLDEFGADARVWDPARVIVIPDHFIHTADEDANANLDVLRRFVGEQGIGHFYDAHSERYSGVCHVTMAENGHNHPGEILFGTDSHTCTAGAFGMFASGIGNTDAAFVLGTGKLWVRVPETMRFIYEGVMPSWLMAKDLILAAIGRIGVDGATYRMMEFCGPTVAAMDMSERMTLCNMAVEAGAKSGIIAADEVCREHVRLHGGTVDRAVNNDRGARFHSEHRFSVDAMAPQVARPHSPGNAVPVDQVAGERIDRCYIGSCTGGKLEDFLAAARLLQGRQVVCETVGVPATVPIARALAGTRLGEQSVLEVLESAGVRMGPPSCAACLGGPEDTFGRLSGSQVCISTTNRNFPGRMGSPDSSVFLASPYTVAASALKGVICDPREFLR